MFVLRTVEAQLRIEPADLGKELASAVASVVERNFLDKVVHDVGLVVTVWDVLRAEGGLLHVGEGAMQVAATFRLVVFRPALGEVAEGRLVRGDEAGLHLSLEFFEDVLIPGDALQEESRFDAERGVWAWDYGDGELVYEAGERVRFKVTAVDFHKPPTSLAQLQAPPPAAPLGGPSSGRATVKREGEGGGAAAVKLEEGDIPAGGPRGLLEGGFPLGSAERPFAPMRVVGSMKEDGLGLLSWWEQAADAPMEEGEG